MELLVEHVLCDVAKAMNIAQIKKIRPCEEPKNNAEKLIWECTECGGRSQIGVGFHSLTEEMRSKEGWHQVYCYEGGRGGQKIRVGPRRNMSEHGGTWRNIK
jgi:hypothetical protein